MRTLFPTATATVSTAFGPHNTLNPNPQSPILVPIRTPRQTKQTTKRTKLTSNPKTRITSKYHFPTETPSARTKRAKSQARKASKAPTDAQPASASTTTTPVACLTLKTYNPTTGIVLQYQTNKIAEVTRLITGLGKLASGADVASLGLSGPGVVGGDVEMVDAPVEEVAAPAVAGQTKGQGQGGKGKKKGGKGKR